MNKIMKKDVALQKECWSNKKAIAHLQNKLQEHLETLLLTIKVIDVGEH